MPVPAIGLGCAGFTFAHADDPDRAARAVRTALDAGISLLDTALAYATADGRGNEALLRRILGTTRVFISTKGGHYRDGRSFPIDGRPETLRRHCEQSLRGLGVERIDLYHLHWPDPAVPIEESVGALADLQRAGKVDQIGVSNVDLGQLRAAHGAATIASVQNQFSLFHRSGRDVLQWCAEQGVAFLAYSPLGAGRLGTAPPSRTLTAITQTYNATPAQIAIAWLLAQSPVIIPIVGATGPDHVAIAAAAADLILGDDELAALDRCDNAR